MDCLSAIILSNNNKNFIHSTKSFLTYKYGMRVFIALNYIEVLNYVSSIDSDILIIDLSSIDVSENLISIFSNTKSKFFIPNIIYVGELDNNIEGCECVCSDNFEEEFDRRIVSLYVRSREGEIKLKDCTETAIGEYLMSVGFNTSHMGYYYIRDSVQYLVSNGLWNACLSKYVYTYLSNKYHKTVCSIEKNIRYAVKVTNFKDAELSNNNIKKVLTLLANKYISKHK